MTALFTPALGLINFLVIIVIYTAIKKQKEGEAEGFNVVSRAPATLLKYVICDGYNIS